jgi:hypothetical protein
MSIREQAATAARLGRTFHELAGDHEGRARRRADHDVGFDHRGLELGPRARLAADLVGEGRRALRAAIDHDELRAPAHEQLRRGLGHLPRAHQQRSVAREVAEDLARQIHSDARDGDLPGADGRVGAHAFSDAHRVVHRLAEGGAERALFLRELDGVLQLAEDLGLAHDEGVERGRHAEQVTHRVIAFGAGQVRAQDLPVAEEHVAHGALGLGDLHDARRAHAEPLAAGPGRHVHLDAVTRRQDHGLADGGLGEQAREHLGQRLFGQRQALAHLERRVFVRQADDGDHGLNLRARPPPATAARGRR